MFLVHCRPQWGKSSYSLISMRDSWVLHGDFQILGARRVAPGRGWQAVRPDLSALAKISADTLLSQLDDEPSWRRNDILPMNILRQVFSSSFKENVKLLPFYYWIMCKTDIFSFPFHPVANVCHWVRIQDEVGVGDGEWDGVKRETGWFNAHCTKQDPRCRSL